MWSGNNICEWMDADYMVTNCVIVLCYPLVSLRYKLTRPSSTARLDKDQSGGKGFWDKDRPVRESRAVELVTHSSMFG